MFQTSYLDDVNSILSSLTSPFGASNNIVAIIIFPSFLRFFQRYYITLLKLVKH